LLEDDNEQFLSRLIKKYKSDERKLRGGGSRERVVSGVIYTSSMKPNIKDDNPLTFMEMLCLILMVLGKENEVCAKILNISAHSIKTYEQRVRSKLGAKNRANALYIALSKGYIQFIL